MSEGLSISVYFFPTLCRFGHTPHFTTTSLCPVSRRLYTFSPLTIFNRRVYT